MMNTYYESEFSRRNRQLVKVSLGIILGDEFNTYEEFDKLLKEMSKKHFVHFWKRDCRTVEGAKKKTERYIDPKIKYYQLKYSCVHGGRMFKRKNQANSETKSECEANFYLIATPEGTKLFVKSLNSYHNHEVSESTYLQYFMEERVKRGRPRKKKQMIEEPEVYNPTYTDAKSDTTEEEEEEEEEEEDETMNPDDESDTPTTVNLQDYESTPTPDQNSILQFDSSLYNQDATNSTKTKDDDIDQFLNYLGSEIKQIKNNKMVKTLKRRFITLVQKAQDEEDST